MFTMHKLANRCTNSGAQRLGEGRVALSERDSGMDSGQAFSNMKMLYGN